MEKNVTRKFNNTMERLGFYKEMYFKEHEAKHKLDDKVSVHIAILTLIVSINTYILKSELSGNLLVIAKYNMLITGICVVLALFYLGKSFMNLGRAYGYREIGSMNEFRNYDEQLKAAGNERIKEYEEHLEKEFADCATTNRSINITRTEKLATCKQWVFVAFSVSFVTSVIYIVGIYIIPK